MGETIRIEKPILPAEGHGVRVIAEDAPVAIFRVGGELYAIDARCPHAGGPLERGTMTGPQVTCPWHGSVFDVRDGSLIHGPATQGAEQYRVRVDGDTLVLERY